MKKYLLTLALTLTTVSLFAQWTDETGVNVGAGYDVKVLPLSNGEAIVSWLPGNEGVFQKFDAGGNPVWANPVTIQPLVAGHKTSAGEFAEMSNGDFVMIFHDRGGFGLSSIPGAQRYDTDGNAVWTLPVALTDGVYTVFNRRYPLRQDGDNLYFGYSGAVGLKFYSYLQRLNPDGFAGVGAGFLSHFHGTGKISRGGDGGTDEWEASDFDAKNVTSWELFG